MKIIAHIFMRVTGIPIPVMLMLDVSILYTGAYMIKKDYLIRALQNHDSFVTYGKIDLIVAFSLD